jgi:hypothetical protein
MATSMVAIYGHLYGRHIWPTFMVACRKADLTRLQSELPIPSRTFSSSVWRDGVSSSVWRDGFVLCVAAVQRGRQPRGADSGGLTLHLANRVMMIIRRRPLTFLEPEPTLTGEKVGRLYTWCQFIIPRVPRFSWVTENLSGGVADIPGPSAQFLRTRGRGFEPRGRPSFFVLISVIRRGISH